jgi:hypothetical protein
LIISYSVLFPSATRPLTSMSAGAACGHLPYALRQQDALLKQFHLGYSRSAW